MPALGTDVFRVLRCVIGEQTYGLAMAYVSGIQRTESLEGQPGPQGFLGTLSTAGGPLPVFGLAARLGQPQAAVQPTGKIVLFKAHSWALYVDNIAGVIQVAQEYICALPALVQPQARGRVDAVMVHEGQLLLSLSPAGLYPDGNLTGETVLQPLRRTVSSVPPASASHGQLLSFTTIVTAEQARPWRFALSLSQVSQILHRQELLPVPGISPAVLGLTWWRDHPLAVLDLARCVGGGTSVRQADCRLLVARAASTQAFVGFPVCPDIQLWQLPLAHRPSTHPLPLQTRLIRGQFDLQHTTLVIPDIDAIVQSQEELSC